MGSFLGFGFAFFQLFCLVSIFFVQNQDNEEETSCLYSGVNVGMETWNKVGPS